MTIDDKPELIAIDPNWLEELFAKYPCAIALIHFCVLLSPQSRATFKRQGLDGSIAVLRKSFNWQLYVGNDEYDWDRLLNELDTNEGRQAVQEILLDAV